MRREKRLIAGGFLLLAAALQGCWLEESYPREKATEGMVPIASSKRQTVLGSEDPYAKTEEEAPRVSASFDYDFFMDRTEVTQAAYEGLMGRNPATTELGRGGDYPVYNVTWYDALLYCNARSKSKGLDTVYAYAGMQQDMRGRTSSLEGLNIRYEVRGYRLPTEAEWEFAARGGVSSTFPWGDAPDSASAARVAWHTANSGGMVHPVKQLKANAYGLHDMTGNVMEWVNDWKGPYAAVTVENFLGAREPGLIAERAVKGGAFSYDFRYLRFSGRSANYATLGSAAAGYVGFRTVLGPVLGGQYLSDGQAHAATPPTAANPAGAVELFGHNKVKLVFVNTTSATRTLCYVNFSENPVTVREFLDDSTVFTPVSSPDGQWVAYADRPEGDTRPGTVKIRRLATGSVVHVISGSGAIPRWWVDPASRDTFLVVADNIRDNTDPAWPSDQTYRVRIAGCVAAGGWEFLSPGGYHDGLSSDGQYLATGYRRLKMRNQTSGNQRVLFTGPSNGKPAGDTSQVCNVSLHPNFGANPRVLFLDFGYSGKSSVVGRPYGLHEILFETDTSGNVTNWYNAPEGFVAWQDAEWSNHPEFVVATGQDQSQGYPAVVGASLRNSTTAVLATGTALRDPGLWVDPRVSFPSTKDPGVRDSMGRYNEPQRGAEQADFAVKMKVFWLNRNSVELVSLGSSRVLTGIRPEAFHHFDALNLGYTRGGVVGAGEILRNYVLPHSPRLRAVVFEVLPAWFFIPEGDNGLWVELAATHGYVYDRAHDFWRQAVPRFMDSLMRERPSASLAAFDERGGTFFGPGSWGANPPALQPLGTGILPDSLASAHLALLRSLALSADSLRVLFVMTLFPESPAYKATPYYGKYGPPREVGETMVAEMKQMCAEIPHCRFYDARQGGNHDYDGTMAVNEDHLSTKGAIQLSGRLDSALVHWLSPSSP